MRESMQQTSEPMHHSHVREINMHGICVDMSSADDAMHPSLSLVLSLQSHSWLDPFWSTITLCGDPHLVYLYIIPVLYAVTPVTAIHILCTLVCTDYVSK